MIVFIPEITGGRKSNFSKLKNARLNKLVAVNRYSIFFFTISKALWGMRLSGTGRTVEQFLIREEDAEIRKVRDKFCTDLSW